MPIFLSDYSNTVIFHREPLIKAIETVNSRKEFDDILLLVSTKNMILTWPYSILSRRKTIVNLVGFGRLYTDYGLLGRFIFNLIVRTYGKYSALAFIVEHNIDKKIIEGLIQKPVYQTHGSGLNPADFIKRKQKFTKNLTYGYMSRFHKSKGSDQILKLAKELPPDKELIIAGWDVRKSFYTKAFGSLSKRNKNIIFLGPLKSRKEVSEFFNSIDCFLCPSVREGGCISLQEAIWHLVPFITTDVPGCSRLAEIFNCPAIELKDFAKHVQKINFEPQKIDTSNWRSKLKPFYSETVTEELIEILLAIIDRKERQVIDSL